MSSTSAVSTGAAVLAQALDLGGSPILRALAGGARAVTVLAPRTASATATRKATTTTAAKTTTAKKPSTTAKPASTVKKTTTSAAGAYAFLDDPSLSVEDKLLRFMLQVQKETDADLQARMDALAGKGTAGSGSTSGSSTTKKSSGTSIWSIAKAILPPLGLASSVVGDATLKKLVQQVSGPMLAAAATAVGLPALAPVATKLGSSLGTLVTSGTASESALASVGLGALGGSAGSAGTSSSSGSGGTASTSAEDKQQELMLLQHAMDKQKEMTSMVSNLLKSMHDGRMNVIGNLR